MALLESLAFQMFCVRNISADEIVVSDSYPPVKVDPKWYDYRTEILLSGGKYIHRSKGCPHGHVGFIYASNKTCVICSRERAAAKREEEQKRLQAAREASAAKRHEAEQKRLQAAREARVTAMFDKAAALREESDKVYLDAMALAAKPLDEEIEGLSPRQAAISRGERWYMPDTPCPKCGQMAERYVATGACRGCK